MGCQEGNKGGIEEERALLEWKGGILHEQMYRGRTTCGKRMEW